MSYCDTAAITTSTNVTTHSYFNAIFQSPGKILEKTCGDCWISVTRFRELFRK